jgi:uncharacterized 2Fe-2S/4Fe-4S cluster protein (DUF4445 family)
MPRVVFTPAGREGVVPAGTTVLDAARRLGIDLDSVCGGRGICGRCQVTPSTGLFAKWSIESDTGALSAPGGMEADYHGRRQLEDRRLGCAATVLGDAVIDVPADSQVHRQIVRKSINLADVILDPAVTLAYVEVPLTQLGDARSVIDSLTEVLLAQHGYRLTETPRHVLRAVHRAVDSDGAGTTVALRANRSRSLRAPEVEAFPAGNSTAQSDSSRPASSTRPGAQPARAEGNGGRGDIAQTDPISCHGTSDDTSDGYTLAAAWPGFVDTAYGIAVDIGSTTIAGHLCDLFSGEVLASAGRMNPQIRFGEDLMSRVSYVMMNPGGDRELTESVRMALDELVGELRQQAGDIAADRVLEVVIVGNPIMHHVLLGIDPTPLGMAPFTLATADAVHCAATELDVALPHARVYLLPCIAGHVGADTAGAILSEGPYRQDQFQLLVDVGTNAEIVLGNRHVMFAASSPTGPAFEGAQISAGQRATAGAIERVRIDRETLEPKVKVIGCDLWSDDPGFAEATADLSISGICGSGIIEAVGEMYLSGIIATDGTINGSKAEHTTRIFGDGRTFSYRVFGDGEQAVGAMSEALATPAPPAQTAAEPLATAKATASARTNHPDRDLAITQNDVRAIQLAKGALRAGIELLMAEAGVTELADIRLAGAFGSHIDPLYARVLGLVPDSPAANIRGVGNAAGAGAVRALLSRALRHEIEQVVARVTKIETAVQADFQVRFVDAMAFPHASAPTPFLAAEISMPVRDTADADTNASGGRRRRRPMGPNEATKGAPS